MGIGYVLYVLAPRFIFISISHYIQSLRESSRVFTEITQNVTKIRCKYCKLHQITPVIDSLRKFPFPKFMNKQGLNADSTRDN